MNYFVVMIIMLVKDVLVNYQFVQDLLHGYTKENRKEGGYDPERIWNFCVCMELLSPTCPANATQAKTAVEWIHHIRCLLLRNEQCMLSILL